MDTYSDEVVSKLKPYTIQQVLATTALFGPLAGGFLVSRSYKAVGLSSRSQVALVVALVMFLLALSVVYFLPKNISSSLTNIAFNALWTAFAYFVFHFDLTEKINQYAQQGGIMASGGRAFLVGLVALAVSLGIILGVEQLSFNLKYDEVEICGKARLLYQKPVDETRAKAIARVIRERNFYDGESEVDIFLQDDGDRYKLTFILNDISLASTPDILFEFNDFESGLNFNLNFKKHIDIFFVDPYLNNEVELGLSRSDEFKNPFRYLYDSRRRGFFFGDLVNLDDVEKIKESMRKLDTVRIANLPICLIYVYSDTGYMLKFCVDKKYWDDSNTIQQVKFVVDRLISGGFVREVKVVLYDYKNQSERKVKI